MIKYYKVFNDDGFIGVGTSDSLRKFQLKHNILLVSDEESAQYIQINDLLYHANWFQEIKTALFEYKIARVILITEEEYLDIIQKVEDEQEILITDEEYNLPDEKPKYNPNQNYDIEEIKTNTINQMSSICNATITNGFDIILTDGKVYHFSLTTQDQLNLITLSSMIAQGLTEIPYHADGELCKSYSVEDITKIMNFATQFKTYHVTYYNSLKSYIESIDNVDGLFNIYYGMTIPEEYQSDILKSMALGQG